MERSVVKIVDLPQGHFTEEMLRARCAGAEILSIPRLGEVPQGVCYYAVDDCVLRLGGNELLGWRLMMIPGMYALANHHSVYVGTDGSIQDITAIEGEPLGQYGTTRFIPDSSIYIDKSKPILIANRHVPIRDTVTVRRTIRAYREMNDARKALAELIKSHGLDLSIGKVSRIEDIPEIAREPYRDWERKSWILGELQKKGIRLYKGIDP